MLGDAHLADDVLQATFLVLARKARTIRQRDSLAGWLYGVTQRLARQARLAEAARGRRERRAAAQRKEAPAGDPGWDELLRVLDEELQRLPERFRLPLLLCYLEGRTKDEAAKQLGWSLSTLRRRLESGRELLRARMTRRGATLGAALFAGFLAPSAARAVLTVGLRRAVLTTAMAGVRGAVVPASVLALANGGMRMAVLMKVCLWLALVLATGGVFAGVAWQAGSNTETSEPPPPTQQAEKAEKQPDRRDRFNDPLPAGAVARLGTLAFRHGRVERDGGSLTFTPDGKHLVSAGRGWIRRWDLSTGHASVNLGDDDRASMVGTELVTADGKLARIGRHVQPPLAGRNWECAEYDVDTGQQKRTFSLEFPRNTNDAHGMPSFLSPDGKTYAELNLAGKLTLWNAADGSVTHHLVLQGGAYTALAFTPDSKTVIVGDDGHTFRVFELATGKEQRTFGILNGNAVARMATSPDGKWLVTAGGQKGDNPMIWPHDRFLRLWNLEEGSEVRRLDFPEDYGAASLLFTPDSGTVIAGTHGGKSGSLTAVRS